MSTVTEIHEHQWCYVYDVVLEEVSKHRAEWCFGCGSLRVMFDTVGWSYMRPDWLREAVAAGRLVEKHTFVSQVPDRVHTEVTRKPAASRLGRGLKDLIAQNPVSNYRGLFPVPDKED